jgi:hypothetical protein
VAAAVAAVTIILTAAGAARAPGDVLRLEPAGGDTDRPTRPTLLLPDGGRRRLALVPPMGPRAAIKAFTVSPDRTRVAMTVGTRLILVPTDGRPASVLRDPALHRGPEAPVWAGVGSASAWWNASGSGLTTGPLRTASGASAVRRCTVAVPTCRTDVLRGTVPVGALPDGRLLLTEDHGVLEPALSGRYAPWHHRSAAWVRRMRALLQRPRITTLRVEAGPGAPGRVTWRRRRPASAAVVRFQALAPTGTTSGALILWDSTRLRLHTRRLHGRLQARVAVIRGTAGTWRIAPDGRRRTLPAAVAGRTTPIVSLPDGGWLVQSSTVVRGQRVNRPARTTADGRIVPLRVAGRPITPWTLHDALGRPPTERLPVPDPEFGSPDVPVRMVGFEQATNSLVVVYDEANGEGVARIPLDGGRASLVELVPGLGVGYIAW